MSYESGLQWIRIIKQAYNLAHLIYIPFSFHSTHIWLIFFDLKKIGLKTVSWISSEYQYRIEGPIDMKPLYWLLLIYVFHLNSLESASPPAAAASSSSASLGDGNESDHCRSWLVVSGAAQSGIIPVSGTIAGLHRSRYIDRSVFHNSLSIT